MVKLLEGFVIYSLSEVLVSKGFFRSCFLFLWVYMLCQRFFFRFSMFVRVFGGRRLLQVLRFGVSEV